MMDFIYIYDISPLFFLLFPFLIVLVVIIFIIFKKSKNSKLLKKGMNMVLFSVSIPQDAKPEKETPLEDYLKTAEQFFSSLAGIKEKDFILGNPYFIFEISVHRMGEEIYFYVSCPRKLAQLMEKQILSFWPKAQLLPIEDYNMFNAVGASLGGSFSLLKNSVLPLKGYQEFKVDPISSITNVLTKLEKEGEGAAVQICFKPSKKGLKGLKVAELMQKGEKLESAIAKANKGVLKETIEAVAVGDKKEEKSASISPAQQDVIAAISKKSSQPLFDVDIRLFSSAKEGIRAKTILDQLVSAFEQFNSPNLNSLKFKSFSGRSLRNLFYRFSFRLFNEKEAIKLSSGELSAIFHFPSVSVLTPNIRWLKAKQAPPPINLPEDGMTIGKSIFRSEERQVNMEEQDRLRHFYIIGQTGTGKSVLLQEMIRQDIEEGKGVALIDPHGDLAEKVLSLIPAERAEDVVYFNPGDIEKPLGLNMLEFDPRFPESKTFVVNELIEIFEKLYNLKAQGFGGPIFEQYMRNSLLLVMEDPDSGSTLIEIPKVLSDASFRKYKLSKCKNIVVKNFWELEAEKAGGEAALANMVPYITSKMNVFIANDLVRPIISQQKSAFNIRDIMDQGKILIVNLAKGKLGDVNSYLLGMIIVGKILLAAFSRADVPEEKRRNFFLYIDEFHNVTTKTISAVLAEARKYRLSMIFGHQFIGQLEEDTKKAIFGNVGSMLAFRIGIDDAKYLITQYEPVFSENDLVNLDNYNGVLRMLINGQTTKPFNIITYPPEKGNIETAVMIKELSRLKYGKDRMAVETELGQRLQKKQTL